MARTKHTHNKDVSEDKVDETTATAPQADDVIPDSELMDESGPVEEPAADEADVPLDDDVPADDAPQEAADAEPEAEAAPKKSKKTKASKAKAAAEPKKASKKTKTKKPEPEPVAKSKRAIGKEMQKKSGKARKDKEAGDKHSSTKPIQDKIKKPRRFRPGTVALREIRKFQKTTNLMFAKRPFQMVVREIASDFSKDGVRFQKNALLMIQEACEDLIVNLFHDGQKYAIHAKRVTLMDKDLALGLYNQPWYDEHAEKSHRSFIEKRKEQTLGKSKSTRSHKK